MTINHCDSCRETRRGRKAQAFSSVAAAWALRSREPDQRNPCIDAYDAWTTKLAREDNDANVIAFSGWRQSARSVAKLIDLFLATKFSTATRHRRRVAQLE